MNGSKNIIVTGGAGFIGSHLVERLLKDSYSVTVIDDLSTGSIENLSSVRSHPELKLIISKVSECKELSQFLENASYIYHLAAAVGVELVLNEPVRAIKTNIYETEVILEHAAKNRTPILIASTSEVYGKSQASAFSEEDDLIIGPPHLIRWGYACSKLLDEFLAMSYARDYHLPVTIARIFNTVGPRQTGKFGMVLPRFVASALKGEPIKVYGDGTQTRCFCYVLDTVEALIRLKDCPSAKNQIFNIGTDNEIEIRALAELVIKLLNSNSEIKFIPYSNAYPPGFQDMQRRKPVIDKIRKFTGFSPSYSLEDIIKLTAEYIKKNNLKYY